jgi:ribulose-phosphate 3-epimerase
LSWSQLAPNSPHKDSGVAAVAPSLLAADFTRLEDEVRAVEKAGVDLLHLDVMDGHFVNNITFGPMLVKAFRRLSGLPLDTHLMIENPDQYIPAFIDAGADIITIHVEASTDMARDLKTIRDAGCGAGITLNPDTPFSDVEPFLDQIDLFLVMSVVPGWGGQSFIERVLTKVEAAKKIREEKNLTFAIEIDGGLDKNTAPAAVKAGVDIVVAGSYIFKHPNYDEAVQSLRTA